MTPEVPTEREKFVFMAALYHLTDGDTETAVPRDVVFAEVNRISTRSDDEIRKYGRAAVSRRRRREMGVVR